MYPVRSSFPRGLGTPVAWYEEWIKANPEYPIRLDLALTDEARSAWKGDHVGEDGALGKMLEMVRAESRFDHWWEVPR